MDPDKQARLNLIISLLGSRDYNTRSVEELVSDATKLEAFVNALPPEVLEKRVLH